MQSQGKKIKRRRVDSESSSEDSDMKPYDSIINQMRVDPLVLPIESKLGMYPLNSLRILR